MKIEKMKSQKILKKETQVLIEKCKGEIKKENKVSKRDLTTPKQNSGDIAPEQPTPIQGERSEEQMIKDEMDQFAKLSYKEKSEWVIEKYLLFIEIIKISIKSDRDFLYGETYEDRFWIFSVIKEMFTLIEMFKITLDANLSKELKRNAPHKLIVILEALGYHI